MGFTNWFWNLFPGRTAQCIACDCTYAKDAMKELWFKYDQGDAVPGTSSVFVCTPCVEDMQRYIEDEITSFDGEEFEVD